MTLQPDSLTEFLTSISYLKDMYRLNIELLEQLTVASDSLLKNNVYLPNRNIIVSLLTKANTLLVEIQADEPKVLQYNISRRKVTNPEWKDKTDGEVPVPETAIFLSFCFK